MDNSSNAPISVRQVIPSECQQLALFVQQHGAALLQVSPLFLLHHSSSCWVYLHPETQEVSGLLMSWKSPSQYSTAVIEGLVAHPQANRNELAGCLLQVAIEYWTTACVRNLVAPNYPPNHWLCNTFSKAGFAPQLHGPIRLSQKTIAPEKICLHQKKMRPTMNSANGQVSDETLFEYFQDGNAIWGTYAGGEVVRGVLIGQMNANRDIRFQYFQIDKKGNFYQGRSKSSTEFLNDGRIALYEDWEWTANKEGKGNSIIEEIKE